MIKKISIVGSGNVATVIGQSLVKNGIIIREVYSQSESNAKVLARMVGATVQTNLGNINIDIDLLIIAVRDDVIKEVVKNIPKEIAIVHTSGAISINVLSKFKRYGIMYPFQTFSKSRLIPLNSVPFFIEAVDSQFLDTIKDFITYNLSPIVMNSSSESRVKLHLAGVLTSNFTTQLLIEAQNILDQVKIPLSALEPLLKESVQKSFDIGPSSALTGPAKRGDKVTMNNHLKVINDEQLEAIYELLSHRITQQQK